MRARFFRKHELGGLGRISCPRAIDTADLPTHSTTLGGSPEAGLLFQHDQAVARRLARVALEEGVPEEPGNLALGLDP